MIRFDELEEALEVDFGLVAVEWLHDVPAAGGVEAEQRLRGPLAVGGE